MLYNCDVMFRVWLISLTAKINSLLFLSHPVDANTIPKRCRPIGRDRTGLPCSVGLPTANAPGGRLARPPAELQTTTDDSEQNNTGPIGVSVIN